MWQSGVIVSGSRYVSLTLLLCCSQDACANIDSCTATIPEKACCFRRRVFRSQRCSCCFVGLVETLGFISLSIATGNWEEANTSVKLAASSFQSSFARFPGCTLFCGDLLSSYSHPRPSGVKPICVTCRQLRFAWEQMVDLNIRPDLTDIGLFQDKVTTKSEASQPASLLPLLIFSRGPPGAQCVSEQVAPHFFRNQMQINASGIFSCQLLEHCGWKRLHVRP